MDTFHLIWNWFILVLLAVLVMVYAVDLWKLYRRSLADGAEGVILKLRRENRALWLLVAFALLLSRVDHLMNL